MYDGGKVLINNNPHVIKSALYITTIILLFLHLPLGAFGVEIVTNESRYAKTFILLIFRSLPFE